MVRLPQRTDYVQKMFDMPPYKVEVLGGALHRGLLYKMFLPLCTLYIHSLILIGVKSDIDVEEYFYLLPIWCSLQL
jgi:hypothetical protein